MGIIDTPRSVNVITRAQLEDRQIFSVQDLGQFSSGTYTPAEYGLDGIPYIAASMRSFSRTDSERFFIEIVLFRTSIKWSRSIF